MQESNEGMLPVAELAKIKGIEVEKVIDMIREGLYSGRKVGDEWFVESPAPSLDEKLDAGMSTKSNKSVLIGIGLGVLVISAFLFLAPNYQIDKIKGLFTASTDERKCFNFHKESLKDPETAYFVDSYIWTKENDNEYGSGKPDPVFKEYDSVLRIKAQAKNGFGAYGDVRFECPLKNGKFDKHYSRMWEIQKTYK
tara:strand:- start:1419 stop:2006 length:588 start_codon:yes stop_codon:yes gene_type:complete